MIVSEVSASSITILCDDGRIFLIGRDLGVNTEGVVAIEVTFHREGLTDGICYEKFDTDEGRRLQLRKAEQFNFFGVTQDGDGEGE